MHKARNNQVPGAVDTPKRVEFVLQVGIQSDVGPSRSLNEDCADYCIPEDEALSRSKGALFVVADGMGGHQAGEVASQEAVRIVLHDYYASEGLSPGDSLVRAIKLANRTLYAQAYSNTDQSGMGTTMVAAAVLGHKVYVANVGDSRAYILKGQDIAQITEDHSWVEEQVQAGLMTREQATRHPQRNLITRALGSRASVNVDLFEGELAEGDVLLLCTDGLSGPVAGEQIVQVVRANSPGQAAAHLVALAGAQGGDDNATLIIVEAKRPRPPAEELEDQAPTVVSESAPTPRIASALETISEHVAALRDRYLQEPRQRLVVAIVGLLLSIFLCGTVVLLLILGNPGEKAAAAPQPAPIYDLQMDNMAMEQLAEHLGYRSIEEISTGQEGLSSAGLWPAQRGLLLAGEANDHTCIDRTCFFDLEMAGSLFEITYQPQKDDRLRLEGHQVRVFGYQPDNGAPVSARFIERISRRWPFGQADWQLVYQAGSLDQLVWVYGTIDVSPYGILAPGALPGLAESDRVLLRGQWQLSTGRPAFYYAQAYILDGGRYVPYPGGNAPQGQPTVTLEPINTRKP
ncbi:MAG: Stp1/IreP family PP2C-type Ser/Thr phosphatase [Anaerolineae bacterium]